MSAVTVTTWTCDRCGATWQTEKNHRDQPPWFSLRLHNPPEHADPCHSITVCKECESSYADWIGSGKETPAAARGDR